MIERITMFEKREAPLSLYIKEYVDRSPLPDHEIGVLCGFKSGKNLGFSNTN
jgi:hypothetical protein